MTEILETAKKMLEKGYICNHCLGRQFAQLLSGFTNEERGQAIRMVLAMQYDLKPFNANMLNFHNFTFRKGKPKKNLKKCYVCRGVFKRFRDFEKQVERKLRKIEFNTFLVGTKLSSNLIKKEEELWENIGISHCEPIKAEINREFGKIIQEKIKKEVDEKNPDINIILNLKNNSIEVKINPLFIFGKYKKLVRGIPQTKWDMYKETVEDIIAKPFMGITKGSSHSFHGAGREDIDAKCLDWRPFVFEVKNPLKRKIDLKKIEEKINKSGKVKVSSLNFSNKEKVREIKSMRSDKTYRVVAVFQKPVRNLHVLKRLEGKISQKTPARVMHRRADLTRIREVKSIKWKKINSKKIEFEIKAESGLYVKELITGDEGRTKPSASELLSNPSKIKELDVIKIWK